MDIHKLSAVLIDDELNALMVLDHLLTATGNVQVVARETNPNLGLRQIVVHKPDLAFVDVDMPQKDGITLLKEINELGLEVKVVIVSAFDSFVFKAFKNSAIDFLLKPIILDDLQALLTRIKGLQSPVELDTSISILEESHKLKLISGGQTLLLEPDQILYLKADGNYTNIMLTSGKVHLITMGLGKLESQLSKEFYRLGRSVIINTSYLTGLIRRKRLCILSDGEKEYPLKVSCKSFYELENLIN